MNPPLARALGVSIVMLPNNLPGWTATQTNKPKQRETESTPWFATDAATTQTTAVPKSGVTSFP